MLPRRAADAEGKLQEVRSRFAQDEQKALKASQMSKVKAVLTNNELAAVGKPGRNGLHEEALSDTTNTDSGISMTASDQPSKKQLSKKDHFKSPEALELQEARALITRLVTDQKKLEDSLKQAQSDNERLSKRNAKLELKNLHLSNAMTLPNDPLATDRARRRQQIIRRICHLANLANKCIDCHAQFVAKLVWDEQHFHKTETEPNVTLKCKNCNRTHEFYMFNL